MTGDLFWCKAITLPAWRQADVSARAMETPATPATPMHSRSNGGHSLVLWASLIFIPGNLYVSPSWAFVVAPAVLFRWLGRQGEENERGLSCSLKHSECEYMFLLSVLPLENRMDGGFVSLQAGKCHSLLHQNFVLEQNRLGLIYCTVSFLSVVCDLFFFYWIGGLLYWCCFFGLSSEIWIPSMSCCVS